MHPCIWNGAQECFWMIQGSNWGGFGVDFRVLGGDFGVDFRGGWKA